MGYLSKLFKNDVIAFCKSITLENTYYIFRDNGIEVVLSVNKQMLFEPSHLLNENEVNFIKKNYHSIYKNLKI